MAAVEQEEVEQGSLNSWCQLVCTHECRPPIDVTKETFSFGRSPACDMSFVGCKFMSGNHCLIMKDSEGKAWLHDTSTNGTLVNGNKVKAGQAVKLCNNDEIKLVHRKDLDIGFVFHDLQANTEQETLENTQEYNLDSDSDPFSKDKKKSISEEKNIQNTGKRPHQKIDSTSETDSPAPKKQHVEQEKEGEKSEIKTLVKSHSSIAENLICSICQDIFHDCISLQPCMHSYCASCYSQWMDRSTGCPSCRLKVKRISRNHLVNNLVEAFLKDHPEKRRSKEDIDEMDSKNKITSDMLRPPLQRQRFGMPIFGGHVFIEDESDEDGEEIEEDDDDNDDDFSEESEYSVHYDDDDDDDDDNATYQRLFAGIVSHTDTLGGLFGLATRTLSRTMSRVCRQCPSSVQPSSKPPTTSTSTASTSGISVNNISVNASSASDASASGTSTNASGMGTSSSSASDANASGTSTNASDMGISNISDSANDTNADSPGNTHQSYVCSPSGSHILCLCCMEYMPDRRNSTGNIDVPPQTCSICNRAFCNLYWGCSGRCDGCLNKFKDMTFDRTRFPDNLICDNLHESAILKEYMSDKSITFDELTRKCLEKLDSKEYRPKDSCDVTSASVVCQKCGFRNLQELAYQYRRDIPRADLPDSVTNRTDCYWGRNCRTQKTSFHHARKFSHICEQTRFT